jgi:hemolysin activation/secretion protein
MGLLCLALTSSAFAQVAPDAGRTLQSIKPLPPPPTPPADLGIPKPALPAAAQATGPKLRVQRFHFTGNTVFSSSDLAPLMQTYVGKELSVGELNQAAAAVTAYYRKAGYFLAQAYIPAQDSVQGAVRIAVLEGQIGQFRVNRDPKLPVRESVIQGFLGGVKPGMLIEEPRLERPLLLLNDLPGVRARASFKPGEAVGRSDVSVDVTPLGRRITGGLDIDNYNSRFTGEYRFSPSLVINNPFQLGDQLALKFTESHTNGLTIGQFNYSLPVGYCGTRVGVGYTGLHYRLGEEFAGLNFDTLDAHGDAHVASAFLQHPLVRSGALNLYADLSFDYKLFNDRQDVVGFVNERTNKLGRFGLSGDARDQVGGGGVSTASLSFGVGHLALDTPAVEAADQLPNVGLHTQGVYGKFNYRVSREQTLWRQLSLYAGFTGQVAFNNLDSSEKFFLGGPNGVRAYPLFEATGDEGHIVTGELRYLLPQFTAWFPDTTVFGFIDAGWAKLNHSPPPGTPDNDRHLRAYGFGFNAAKANNYLVRGTLAWHDGDDPLADKDRAPRFWFLVSKQF